MHKLNIHEETIATTIQKSVLCLKLCQQAHGYFTFTIFLKHETQIADTNLII